jgi:Ca2+-binding RTX toxin-like protein
MFAPEGYTGPFGNQTEVGPAELEIMAGGTAKDVVASAGVITMYEGSKDPGTAAPKLSNADVHYSATLIVNCDGAVLDGTLNLGGLVTTTATRYEYVEVEVTDPDTGDTYTDWQRIEKNNAVAVANTLTVNFDLTERDGSDEDAMIDNLANLAGATLGTVTVSADQAEGKYVLAQGAEDFTGTLTVKCGDEVLGNLGVGKYLQVGADTIYSLTNDAADGLCFTVFAEVGAAVDRIVATVDGRELKKGEWVNKSVTVKAYGNQYSKSLWYRIRKAVAAAPGAVDDDGWTQLSDDEGITVAECCEIDFKVKNDKGEDSRIATWTVYYDDVAATVSDVNFAAADPAKPYLDAGDVCSVIGLVADDLDDAPTLELLAGDDWQALATDANGRFGFTVTGNGTYHLRATDHAGNVSESDVTVDAYGCPAVTEIGSDGATWEGRPGTPCEVSIGCGDGEAVLPVTGNAVSLYNLPSGSLSMNIGYAGDDGQRSVAIPEAGEYAPALWQAVEDGVTDVFFARSNGQWDSYRARHVGSVNDWDGTRETVRLNGKNRLCDFFAGAADANVLLLTDDANGDALFVDDIYTELPGEVAEQQSRLARIREIRAGAGDDVVDLTSQRFEYVGDGLTVRGGDGNDTIWANKGDNLLCGDAGNDRLAGASGDDVLVGGTGDDSMHGGGGNDVFAFCENWGADAVEQLAEGKVTLWFASGSEENWDAAALAYTDGTNSVTVKGVGADDVTLKFGDDGSAQYASLADAGAFAGFTSENVFEKKAGGMLAGV